MILFFPPFSHWNLLGNRKEIDDSRYSPPPSLSSMLAIEIWEICPYFFLFGFHPGVRKAMKGLTFFPPFSLWSLREE